MIQVLSSPTNFSALWALSSEEKSAQGVFCHASKRAQIFFGNPILSRLRDANRIIPGRRGDLDPPLRRGLLPPIPVGVDETHIHPKGLSLLKSPDVLRAVESLVKGHQIPNPFPGVDGPLDLRFDRRVPGVLHESKVVENLPPCSDEK